MVHLPQCDSTNRVAMDWAQQASAKNGTVIICDHQHCGRGQFGRSWESLPYKNLTFSVIFYPENLALDNLFQVSMQVSLAIVDALVTYVGSGLAIKWPNDIYFKKQKIGGILIQNSIQANKVSHCIIGIGLNVNQEQFINERAVSLKLITGKEIPLTDLLNRVLFCLEQNLFKSNSAELYNTYVDRLFGYKQWRYFMINHEKIRGQIEDIEESGKLGVRIGSTKKYFEYGTIKFVFE